MKNLFFKISAGILISVFLALPNISFGQSVETDFPTVPSIEGRIEGEGDYFEIKNSQYLNITLKSSEEIKAAIESIPKIISLSIDSTSTASSTSLTIGGLEPNKTYYKYQDSYQNGAVFVSDGNGIYEWNQDLSQPHHIWFQEIKGTTFIDRDTILDHDITGSVEIAVDNITLDCNGYVIKGYHGGSGIYLRNRQGVTIKNCNVTSFSYGIYLWSSSENTLLNNTVFENWQGIEIVWYSHDNVVSYNTTIKNSLCGIIVYYFSRNNFFESNIIDNNWHGICMIFSDDNIAIKNIVTDNISAGFAFNGSSNNIILDNIVTRNQYGAWFFQETSINNKIFHNDFIENSIQAFVPGGYSNFFDNGYSSGGNYWSDYIDVDYKSGPNQDQLGNDGIGDNPYTFTGGQDRYPFMEENGWEAPSPPEPKEWSFATITDLHIGRGYPDYDGEGFDDNGDGEDYYLTERLEKVVNWINENKNIVDCNGVKCSIKFLTVLGDITNTAEKSQFLKAKNILDKLNDPNGDGNTQDGIPYVLVFGNHDVWPYSDGKEADYPKGEEFFEEVFWNETDRNFQLMKERLNFQRDTEHPKYKNSAFFYRGINFIGLDFIKRVKAGKAEIFAETENWLKNKFNEYQGKQSVILFSHHPFAEPGSRDSYIKSWWNFDSEEINKIEGIIDDYENITEGKQVLGTFAGHIHGYYPQEIGEFDLPMRNQFMDANWEYPAISTAPVVATESLIVGSNEKDEDLRSKDKGLIRIVKVLDKNDIDYNTIEGKYNPDTKEGKEFIALNPYISWAYKFLEDSSNPCVFFKTHSFTNRDISSYQWQFGDGAIGNGKIIPLHCYSSTGIYNVTSSLTDAETGVKEEITRKIEIKEGLISKVVKIKNELIEKVEIISQNIEEDLLTFGNYLIKGKDNLLLKIKEYSMPVGEIMVDFDAADGNIDLSEMIFDANIDTKKSILYAPQWPSIIEKDKILFIPK